MSEDDLSTKLALLEQRVEHNHREHSGKIEDINERLEKLTGKLMYVVMGILTGFVAAIMNLLGMNR